MVVLVDAENVRRSIWPNIAPERLVELTSAWAETHGMHAVVVFDGRSPNVTAGARCEVVATATESADDWITRRAAELARHGEGFRLVTSDRELRARAGHGADDVTGGGRFARELLALARA